MNRFVLYSLGGSNREPPEIRCAIGTDQLLVRTGFDVLKPHETEIIPVRIARAAACSFQ
jgi:hypothetical protein